MMRMNARQAALEALERCRKDGAWSGLSLDRILEKKQLEKREAALASRLFLGVLQNSAYCDFYIDRYCSKNASGLQPKLRNILRLGVYQLLFLDKIPARAAVNETVSLCRNVGMERAAGLVNAILRRVAENRQQLPEIPNQGSAEYLSIKYSHPLPLVELFLRERDYAFTEAFLAANNRVPDLTLHVNTLKISIQDYRRALLRAEIPFQEHAGVPGCFDLEGGTVTELPGYEEGLFYVQDRAARCAVLAAAPEEDMQVLDVCAAPGGKSFAAAIAMGDRGSLLACDIHDNKLSLIRSGGSRLGITCLSTLSCDGRQFREELADRFDLVIADVPCSGLGVIRKRPEIRYKKPEDFAGLPAIQQAILNNAARYVKPGGVLCYSTCTVLHAENQDNVHAFLTAHPDFFTEPFTVDGREAKDGMLEFWPQLDRTDGFFIAKMRRNQKET